MTQYPSHFGDPQMTVDNCLKCFEICTKTQALSLNLNEEQNFISALLLCAQSCQLTVQSLLLESPFYHQTCVLTAELCEQVADLCDDFDEPEIRSCGEVCLRCAKSCRAMGSHAAPRPSRQSDVRLV
jgi:hypothetical protein